MVNILNAPGASWDACESELDARGASLPLYHRTVWAQSLKRSGTHTSFVAINDGAGCKAGFAIERSRSRALPGHWLWSIRRLGIGNGGLEEDSLDEGVREIAAAAAADSRVLRVTIDAFATAPDDLGRTTDIISRYGFARAANPRSYEKTLLLDLKPDEEEIFASLHKNARQGVRNIARYPVRLDRAEPNMAQRLAELAGETRSRTQGEHHQVDWQSAIEIATQRPDLSRLVVLRRADADGPSSVIAFALGHVHGQTGEYSESGSTRVDDMKVSTSYALLWDLIVWARKNGATVFDLGGVTSGITHSDDPLGGISDFKRRFSRTEVEVGSQWELHPHPRRAAAARVVSQGAGIVRSALQRMRERR